MEDAKRVTVKSERRAAVQAAVSRRRAERLAAHNLGIMEEICRRITLGMSLNEVCKEDAALPGYTTILRWMAENDSFADMYKAAQRARADYLFDETIVIADDGRNDWMQRNDPNNPGWQANGEHLARSKMRIDTRFKIASKLNAAKYGDKLAVEGDPTKPIVVSVTHRIVSMGKEETGPVIDHQPSNWDEPE